MSANLCIITCGGAPKVQDMRMQVACSGRLEPSYIYGAFERGVDGVLVLCIHSGDKKCAANGGNAKTERLIESMGKVLDTIGLGKDRLRMEWVLKGEVGVGSKVAELVKDFAGALAAKKSPVEWKAGEKKADMGAAIRDIVRETRAYYCMECGKCVSVCPVAIHNPAFAPMRTVERALFSGLGEEMAYDDVWSCLTCRLCTEMCPSSVVYPEFTRGIRTEVFSSDVVRPGILSLMKISSSPNLSQNRLGWVGADMKTAKKGELLYFVGCAPYFESMFEPGTLQIAKNAVRILNKTGVEPVVMPDERCCGHDLLWTGDADAFANLAALNMKMVKEAGAKKIVMSCPEGYRTFKTDYPKYVDMNVEVVHISEYLSDLIEKKKLSLGEVKKKVTYHDPCRLGRDMGVYEAPRKVLGSIPGVELVEMKNNKSNSICCGVNSWVNCGTVAKRIQIGRLAEAEATGAEVLVTSCPKCLIHLRCALGNRMPVKSGIKVEDLTTLVAEAMAIGGGK